MSVGLFYLILSLILITFFNFNKAVVLALIVWNGIYLIPLVVIFLQYLKFDNGKRLIIQDDYIEVWQNDIKLISGHMHQIKVKKFMTGRMSLAALPWENKMYYYELHNNDLNSSKVIVTALLGKIPMLDKFAQEQKKFYPIIYRNNA